LGIEFPPRITIPSSPGFDEPVRAAVERWVNERAAGIPPARHEGFVDEGVLKTLAHLFPSYRVTRPDSDKTHRRVRVVDSTLALSQGHKSIFLCDGVVREVLVTPAGDEYVVDIAGRGVFQLRPSEVKFL
jgi:hypothetical protein